MSYAEAAEILRRPDENMKVWEGDVVLTSAHVKAIEVALRLLDVAADGRFAELPCHFGHPFWWVTDGVYHDGLPPHVQHNPGEDVVEGFLVTRNGVFLDDGSEVGSQYFCLTREQAEGVLAQMEG